MPDNNLITELIKTGSKNTTSFISYLLEPKIESERLLMNIVKEKGYLSDEDIKQAANIRYIRKFAKRYKNYLNVLIKADKISEGIDFNNTSKCPDDDWMEYFEDLSSKFSNEFIQNLWAKILVKEHTQAGSVSKSMMNTISLLDPESALSFMKLCQLTFSLHTGTADNRYYKIPLILYDYELVEINTTLNAVVNVTLDPREENNEWEHLGKILDEYQSFIPSQYDLEYLRELNLIKMAADSFSCDIYSAHEMNLSFSVGDKHFITGSSYDTDRERFFVETGNTFFTRTGQALYEALSVQPYQNLMTVLQSYLEYQSCIYPSG